MAEKHVRLKDDTERLLNLAKAELLKEKPEEVERVTDDITVREALKAFLQTRQENI